MNIPDMIDKLDKATDIAASLAIERGVPIPVSKKSIRVGSVLIEKNTQGLYDITSSTRISVYRDISLFDVAIIIAQKYNSGEMTSVKQVLQFESKFAKYRTDMMHYLHCMRAAKKQNDTERLAILEDKFQVAEQFAKNIRDRLAKFKRVK